MRAFHHVTSIHAIGFGAFVRSLASCYHGLVPCQISNSKKGDLWSEATIVKPVSLEYCHYCHAIVARVKLLGMMGWEALWIVMVSTTEALRFGSMLPSMLLGAWVSKGLP